MTPAVAPSSDEITISEVIANTQEFGSLIWRNRRKLLRPVVLAIPIGLVVAFARRSEYSATMRILPYRTGQNTSNLSGLAGLAGIRLPVEGNEDPITADLYPVLAQTLDFQVAVAETPLRFSPAGKPETLITYFRDHPTPGEVAGRFVGNLRDAVAGSGQQTTGPAAGANGAPLRVYDREYLRIAQSLDARLVVSADKKTSVISITGLMPSPYAAADLVQSASDLLMKHIIDYEAEKAGEDLRFIQEQYSQARAHYEQAQQTLAGFVDRNRILATPVAQVERDRLQNEYNLAFEVYQQLSGQLQLAELRKNQDTPVFAVIEQATVPNQRTSPKRSVILLAAVCCGILVGFLQILYDRYKPTSAPLSIT